MKRKPRIIEVVIPQVPDPVVMAAHLTSPAVPPSIPASVALARAKEDALAVQMRVCETPVYDAVVRDQGWNPRVSSSGSAR